MFSFKFDSKFENVLKAFNDHGSKCFHKKFEAIRKALRYYTTELKQPEK